MYKSNLENVSSKPKAQISTEVKIMAFILAMLAGWIDAVGLRLFFTADSAFMTGRVHLLGQYIFRMEAKLFFGILLEIVTFIIGSFIATIITRKKGLKVGLIAAGILVIISSIHVFPKYMNAIFLPMAMGCQNGSTSLTPLGRTTHVSGVVTDFGINLAKRNWKDLMFWGGRLIGFPLGVAIGLNFAKLAQDIGISGAIMLIIPAIILILIAIIQEKKCKIPLL